MSFLEEHGLGQYATAFVSSGFDELETLLEVDDIDLKDLGLPRGHALKLKRHLREYETNLYIEEDHKPLPVIKKPPPVIKKAPVRVMAAPSHAVPSSRPVPTLEASDIMKGDVERSWDTIQQLGVAEVGERIYRIFFDMVPESMDCFPAHVRHKYRDWTADESDDESDLLNSVAVRKLFGKVLNAIGCVVAGLQESSKLVPLLTSLGRRHIGYNNNEEFWPVLGKAVMMVLAEILGDGFTSEVENAWTVVYGFTSSIMIAGLREAKAAARDRAADDGDCASSQRSRLSHHVAGEAVQPGAARELEWHLSLSEMTEQTKG